MFYESFAKKSGLAIPITITVITLVGIIFLGIWNLLQGLSAQRFYADAHIKVNTIIESAYNIILAKLMSEPWDNRWFKNNPDAKSNIPLEDGFYDYFIQDTPNKERMVDLWIKGQYKNIKRIHFYRIRYFNPILKELSTPSPSFVTSFDENQANKRLNSRNIQDLSQKLSEIISIRNSNRPNVIKKWFEISNLIDPISILYKIGAYLGDDIILIKAISDGNTDTSVQPTQLIKNALNANTFINKIEPEEKLLSWFCKSNNIDQAYARNKFLPIISQINRSVDQLFKTSKYLVGEVLYKEFLEFIFGISVFAKSTANIDIKLEVGFDFYKNLSEAAIKAKNIKEFIIEMNKIAESFADKAKVLEISLETLVDDISSSVNTESNNSNSFTNIETSF